MKNPYRIRILTSRLRTLAGLAVVSAALTPLALVTAADPKAEPTAKTEKPAEPQSKAEPTPEKAKAPPRKLTGAELYSIHCNRCHPERYPTERTAAQWKTILLHMRVRANLPAEQSRTILKYLQDNSGR
jgi:cytochrome c5